MDMSPQRVRTASFKLAKKGFDPDEVTAFLAEAADALEAAQHNSTAMEARARAAVARLQELSQSGGSDAGEGRAQSEDAETISRTLLLAQRTADTAVNEAKTEADRLLSAARTEAASTLDSTREMSAKMLEEAREEARRVGDTERKNIESEVQALLARRDFLEGDVDHLEQFLIDQRSRLHEAALAMTALAEKVPGGLGEARRPLLSASGDEAAPAASGAAPESEWQPSSTSAASSGGPSIGAASASASAEPIDTSPGTDEADSDAADAAVGDDSRFEPATTGSSATSERGGIGGSGFVGRDETPAEGTADDPTMSFEFDTDPAEVPMTRRDDDDIQ